MPDSLGTKQGPKSKLFKMKERIALSTMSSMFSTLLRSNVRVVARLSCRSLSTTAFRSALLHARPNVHVASRQLVGPVQLATRRWFSGEGGPPKRILFAGNLPFNMSEDDIRYEFSNFGTMDKVIIGASVVVFPSLLFL